LTAKQLVEGKGKLERPVITLSVASGVISDAKLLRTAIHDDPILSAKIFDPEG